MAGLVVSPIFGNNLRRGCQECRVAAAELADDGVLLSWKPEPPAFTRSSQKTEKV